jgi:hypothetical protein
MAAEFFRYFLKDHIDIFKYMGNDDREIGRKTHIDLADHNGRSLDAA